MQLRSIDTTGKATKLNVSDQVFGVEPNQVLLAQAIRVYQSNQRQGTSDVKTRAEVSRTTKKWFKQKGTGNARHGSRKAPIFVGGGVAHGPKANQNWSKAFNAKAKRGALATALTLQAEKTLVSQALSNLDGKTASAVQAFKQAEVNAKRVLVVLEKTEDKVVRSLRNLPQVVIQTAARLNALEVALAQQIVMTPEAIKVLETRLTAETKNKTAAPTVQADAPTSPEKKAAPKKNATKKVATKKVAAKKTEK